MTHLVTILCTIYVKLINNNNNNYDTKRICLITLASSIIKVESKGTGLTPKNSTSLQRTMGHPTQAVEGNSTNFPFWPGKYGNAMQCYTVLNAIVFHTVLYYTFKVEWVFLIPCWIYMYLKAIVIKILTSTMASPSTQCTRVYNLFVNRFVDSASWIHTWHVV